MKPFSTLGAGALVVGAPSFAMLDAGKCTGRRQVGEITFSLPVITVGDRGEVNVSIAAQDAPMILMDGRASPGSPCNILEKLK